jgi:hypothetical protein
VAGEGNFPTGPPPAEDRVGKRYLDRIGQFRGVYAFAELA